MVREIRSPFVRYGLALLLFALVQLISFGLPRVIPFRIDFTPLIIIAMIATAWYLGRGPGLIFQVHIKKPVEPVKLAFAVASLGKRVKRN